MMERTTDDGQNHAFGKAAQADTGKKPPVSTASITDSEVQP